MKELQDKLQTLKNKLNKKEQGYLCFRSIENFLLYFDQLQEYHSKVEKLLIEYFNEAEEITNSNDYFIDFNTCKILTKKYIMPIGLYYGLELNFKIQPSYQEYFFGDYKLMLCYYFSKYYKK